jgi:Flp pilus assembly protein TadG
LGFSSEKGAVTAEFMLLLPALALLLASALAIFQLGLDRISLEVSAFEIARANAIGFEQEIETELEITTEQEGRFACVTVSKMNLVRMAATSCMIPYGG